MWPYFFSETNVNNVNNWPTNMNNIFLRNKCEDSLRALLAKNVNNLSTNVNNNIYDYPQQYHQQDRNAVTSQ